MKKTLSLIAIAGSLIFSSQANAKDGFYAGADLIFSNAKYKFQNKTNSNFPSDEGGVNKVDGNGVGVGISAGYKKYFDQVFIAPEIFYDYLNTSVKDYGHTSSTYQGDEMNLRSRYGAKLNLGYDFTNKFSAYLNYGLAQVSYINNAPSTPDSQGKVSYYAPVYGLGAAFKLNDNWAIRAEINQQKVNLRYFLNGSKVTVNTLKTGLVYNF